MTMVVVILSALTLVLVLFSMVEALRTPPQTTGVPARVLLILAIMMLLVVAVGNLLEHAADNPVLDAFEGYTAAMAMPMLLFFALVLRMHREIRRAQRAAMRERRLRDELDHRVRNNLAAVLGLIDLTRRSDEPQSVASFAQLIRSRVLTLSTTHEILSACRGRPVDLRHLCEQMLATFASNDLLERVRVNGPAVQLETHLAAGLALPLHELIQPLTAARELQAHLTWQQTNGVLELSWRVRNGQSSNSSSGDRPSGISATSEEMIRGFVKHELHGRLAISQSPLDEWKCEIAFPLVEFSDSLPYDERL